MQHGLEFIELPEEINLSTVESADKWDEVSVEIAGQEPGRTLTKMGKRF